MMVFDNIMVFYSFKDVHVRRNTTNSYFMTFGGNLFLGDFPGQIYMGYSPISNEKIEPRKSDISPMFSIRFYSTKRKFFFRAVLITFSVRELLVT